MMILKNMLVDYQDKFIPYLRHRTLYQETSREFPVI